MRRIALPLVVLAAALLAAAPAQAIQSIQKADVKVTPNTAGTKAKPQAISMTVKSWFDSIDADLVERQTQFAMVKGDIWFPKEGIHNMKQFASCAPTTVFQDEKLCPADSKIGSGKAHGTGLGLEEDVVLTGFNMPGGKGVVILVVGDSPLIIREVVELNVKTLTSDPKYKYQVSFTIPQNLQSPAPGVLAAVKDLDFKIPVKYAKKKGKYVKKKGQRVPYIATTGCATGAWTGKFTAYYTTSYDSTIESDQTVEVSVPCKKPKKK